jgi:hypothetical protein
MVKSLLGALLIEKLRRVAVLRVHDRTVQTTITRSTATRSVFRQGLSSDF